MLARDELKDDEWFERITAVALMVSAPSMTPIHLFNYIHPFPKGKRRVPTNVPCAVTKSDEFWHPDVQRASTNVK